jgi:hypothetical protein
MLRMFEKDSSTSSPVLAGTCGRLWRVSHSLGVRIRTEAKHRQGEHAACLPPIFKGISPNSMSTGTWLLSAYAQQPRPVRRIVGLLVNYAATGLEADAQWRGRERAAKTWIRYRTQPPYQVPLDRRHSNVLRFQGKLIRMAPDLILANSTPVIAAVMALRGYVAIGPIVSA